MMVHKPFDIGGFKASLKYSVIDRADQIVTDMEGLRRFDAEVEKKVAILTKVGALGIAVLVIGGVTGFIVEKPILGISAVVVGLSLAIVGFSLRFFGQRSNLEDRRYRFVAGLMTLLSKDIAQDTPVTARVDFRSQNDPEKLDRKGRVGPWNVNFFIDDWLQLSGQFMDGTKYSVTLIEKFQERHRTKRSASGKIKHKSKTKSSSEAIVTLKIKPKHYPRANQVFKIARRAVKLPPWVSVKSIQADEQSLTLRTATNVDWNARSGAEEDVSRDAVNWVAMHFLSLYRILHASR